MTNHRTAQPRSHYEHRDTRYVAEYVALTWPDSPHWFNVRLGPAPPELRGRYPGIDVERWAKVWARAADALVLDGDTCWIVEGELRRPVEALGELVVYRELINQTESLRSLWHLRPRCLILTPLPDPTLEVVLRKLDIESVSYRPPWVEEYLRKVQRL